MDNSITVGYVIKTSLVSGFTIAAALIWKEVILDAIEVFFSADAFIYELLVAVIATIIIILMIFFTLKTEYEAERMISILRQMNRKKRKRILKEIKEEDKRIKKEKKKTEKEAKKQLN